MTTLLTLDVLLEYLYNRFAVTFLMVLIGSIIRETVTTVSKYDTINIKKIIGTTLFSTILLGALADYIEIPFAIYLFVCVITGMWSVHLVEMCMNAKIVRLFIKNILKIVSNPIGKAVKETIDDLDKDNQKKASESEDKNRKK